MNKYYKILELDKIINKLKDYVRIEENYNYLNLFLEEDIPLSNDLVYLNKMLDETDEAFVIIQRMGRFEILFSSDINFLITKVNKEVMLSIDEFMEIGSFLDTVRNTIVFHQSLKSSNISCPLFSSYIDSLIYNKDLNLRFKEIFGFGGEILDSASSELKSIRRQIESLEKNIVSKLNEIVSKNASKLTQTIITTRNDRYVIPVKNDFKNTIKGLTHDVSSSGETVFIEPLIILEMNNKLNSLKEEEKKEIHRILVELRSSIQSKSFDIKTSYNILKDLDLIFSKAELSIKLNGRRPKINDKGIFELLNCYHPLLNVEKVISNNIILNQGIKGIIITGPNTGGKTVLLKTIGLLSLMVKMGILIPCNESSNIMIFHNVYSDIGDEQSIDQNLSTFSSHLKNVIDIMNTVDDKSLVLLDELGSGTDPSEGAALAISIFDYLLSKDCLVIASSHYAELKVHAYESNKIINASVEFNIDTLKPTYKLLIGVPGESNALKISRILGLPEEIINKAEHLAYSNSNEINLTLEKLIKTSNELEKKLNEIRNKEYLINKRLEEVDDIKIKTNKERNIILNKADLESKKIIEKKQNEINSLLEELRFLKNKTKDIKTHEISDLTHRFNELKGFDDSTYEGFKIDRNLEVGDNVFVAKFNSSGIIVKINKNRYEVQIGNATVTLSKDELEYRPSNNDTNSNLLMNKKPLVINTKKNVSPRLDLRGMRYEEAESLIDDYLEDSHYAGLKSVTIIHGFGTGVIRELVQKKVRNNRLVKSYRYGQNGEGGNGATVVFFE